MSSSSCHSLAEVADVFSGYAFKSADLGDDGIPVIKIANISGGLVSQRCASHFPEELLAKKLDRFFLKPGDTLVAMTGAGSVGRVGRMRNQDSPYLVNQRVGVIRPRPEKIEPEFLGYFLLQPAIEEQLYAIGVGAGQPNISPSQVGSIVVACPPLETQRRIASILSAYDDLIENNTRRIEILEEMARRLYEEWFVYFRFPGHEQVGFKETELGKIPEGWEIQTVADTFEILGGGTPSKKEPSYWDGGTINWFSPTDLTRSGTAFMDSSGVNITDIGLKKSSARLFPAFSVMMTSRATLGVISINTTEACTNQGFITCLPNDRFPLYILYHWLHANVETFISLGTGATFKEITKGTFKTIPLVVPSHQVANQFQDDVTPLMSLALNLQRKNANLRTQRDLLLPKLVSGEIDVSDLTMPNDTED